MGELIIVWEEMLATTLLFLIVMAWMGYAIKNKKLSTEAVMKRGGYEPLATSPLVPTLYLLLFRVAMAVLALSAWMVAAIVNWRYFMTYYTLWNYTALILYFLCASFFSAVTLISPESLSSTSRALNIFRSAVWVLFQAELALSLLVCITTWTVLLPVARGAEFDNLTNWRSVFMHALNVVFMWTDLMLNDLPLHFHFGSVVVCAPLIYGFFSWVHFVVETRWDYFFLDPSKPINAVFVTGIFAFHFVCWLLAWKVAKWKFAKFSFVAKSSLKQEKLMSINDVQSSDVNNTSAESNEKPLMPIQSTQTTSVSP